MVNWGFHYSKHSCFFKNILYAKIKTIDDLYFEIYDINYKNPQANVYNYTGLTAVSPNGISLIIAQSTYSSIKPTGLYISWSTTPNSCILCYSEPDSTRDTSSLTAICVVEQSRQLYVFDRRAAIPSSLNGFHLLIHCLYRKN